MSSIAKFLCLLVVLTVVGTTIAGSFVAMPPLAILAVGIITVIGMIMVLRINAFIALITAALFVSLMAPGTIESKVERVAEAFGSTTAKIGIVIAMASVVGRCLMDSGAADRIVRAFCNALGQKRASWALMGSGFVLSVPVFFDTVFYLLVPLARALRRRSGKDYLKYLMAISAGGAITHTLVPPTPGPLAVASNLGVDIGEMMLIGALVAIPSAIVGGIIFASLINLFMNVPLRQLEGVTETEPLEDSQLPSLWIAILPVLLPVLLISTNTVTNNLLENQKEVLAATEQAVAEGEQPIENAILPADAPDAQPVSTVEPKQPTPKPESPATKEADAKEPAKTADAKQPADPKEAPKDAKGVDEKPAQAEPKEGAEVDLVVDGEKTPLIPASSFEDFAKFTQLIGDPNFALLVAAALAMWILQRQRKLSFSSMSKLVESSLLSGGLIILITAAGGSFGAMLKEAQIGDEIKRLFGETGNIDGMMYLVLGFGVAAILKVAQGSSTAAMLVGSGMVASMLPENLQELGYHPVYLATAIGSGSLVGSWMNDSGFWIVAKMGGMTEAETLKSWTVLLVVLGVTGFGTTMLLAQYWADPFALPATVPTNAG
ncbi:Gnt-II system L-idonate transporter [Planctomycetes bacterium Pan216]|uniref:Gnt-II system L-idonate transporter n=1 Tax=Kolteria novifilia TaxID=2527975 RepID=A0A518BAY3_9BACT|nr:Gnt-II system L-idonate transporter [Planctomycetes bacterium Pan216]